MYKIKKNNPTQFKISSDESYWIGITSKGDEFFFNGDNDVISYVKSCNWRKRKDGYFQNYKGERINRVVAKVIDSSYVVDHINNNPSDNRVQNLRVITRAKNTRNKSTNKTHGIVGLYKKGNKYYGILMVEGINICTKFKNKNEALIDLLIAQKHFGYLHNQNLYYLIENIDKKTQCKVIECVEEKLKKYKARKPKKNKYILSEDGKYYVVLCNEIDNKNSFKISVEDKELVEEYCWSMHKLKNNKYYIHQSKGGCFYIHRYLYGLRDEKYMNYYVDHINGDSLDNRRENLIITDKKGNNTNIISKKGYHKTKNGKYRAAISIGEYNSRLSKVCDTEEEARKWYLDKKQEQMKKRKTWKNKEELDLYLLSKTG